MARKPREDVLEAVRATLETGTTAIKRDQLVTALRVSWGFGSRRWAPGTLAREVRKAVGWLQIEGVPVASLGNGFVKVVRYAVRARAARVLMDQAAWLLFRAMRLLGDTPQEMAVAMDTRLRMLVQDHPLDRKAPSRSRTLDNASLDKPGASR